MYCYYRCVGSRHATPVGSVRIDFETLPNDHLLAEVYPPGVDDTEIGLVRLNKTQVCLFISICLFVCVCVCVFIIS
jgi:hypothetical protein